MAIPVGSVTQAPSLAVGPSIVRASGMPYSFDSIYNVAVVVVSGTQTVAARTGPGGPIVGTVPGGSPGVVLPLTNGGIWLESLGHGTSVTVTPGTYGTGGGGGSFDPASLPSATALAPADQLVVVQGGTSKKGSASLLDRSALVSSGMIGGYAFEEGSGTTLNDFSGSGNSATFAGGGVDPVWVNGGLRFGSTNGTDNANQYVPLPSALRDALTVQIFLLPRTLATAVSIDSGGGAAQPAILIPSTGTGFALSLFGPKASNSMCLTPSCYNPSFNTYAHTLGGAANLLTWTFGTSGNDRVWVDEDKESSYNTNSGMSGRMATAGATWTLGGTPGVTNFGAQFYFQGVVAYALFYNRVLTDAEILQNVKAVRAIMAKRGVVPEYRFNADVNNRAIALGDSLTRDRGAGAYVTGTYDQTTTTVNYGVSGVKGYSFRRFFKTEALAALSNANERQFISFFYMTNDGNQTDSCAAYLGAVADAVPSFPKNATVAICTLLSRNGQDATKNLINPILRRFALANGFAIVDFGSIPELGADGAAPATSNTYFVDNTHWSATGIGLGRTVYNAAVNYAPYADLKTPFSTSNATYAMTAKDAWLIYTGAGGGNVTLTAATGHTGERRKVTNNTANALTLTAQTTYTELVNGATTYSLPARSSVTLVSVLRSDAAGGCDWIVQ